MASETTDPLWPADFTPSVWAALFPAYPSPPPPPDMPAELARVASPAVAAQARAERPMTLEQLLAGIPDAPLQRAVVRLQLAVVGSSGGDSGFFFATVVYVALHVGLMPALAWVGNWYYGLFGTRQLVAMTVGYVVQDALWEVALLRGRAFARKEEKVLVGTLQERLALDNHLLAGVARYRLLLEDSSDPEAASGELARSLLRHEPGDPLCSCPKAGCAGWHLHAAPALSLATFVGVQCGKLLAYVVISFWTVLVTFQGFTWSSPWAAALAACSVAYCALYVFSVGVAFNGAMSNVAVFGLEMRLRRRAMKRCLDGLIARMEAQAAGSEPPGKQVVESEPYVVLHAALAAAWSSRLSVSESNRFVVTMGFLGDFVAIAIVMFASSCITAPFLASFLLNAALIFVFDLANLAAAYSETSRIAALYSSAAYSLRSLALRAGPGSALAAAAGLHERILRGFADVDAYRATFFGVPVTPGLVRTAAVTAFTIGVGMWSVLRGAGIGVTIEMACPGV